MTHEDGPPCWRVTVTAPPLPPALRQPALRSLFVHIREVTRLGNEPGDPNVRYSVLVHGPSEQFAREHVATHWADAEVVDVIAWPPEQVTDPRSPGS